MTYMNEQKKTSPIAKSCVYLISSKNISNINKYLSKNENTDGII